MPGIPFTGMQSPSQLTRRVVKIPRFCRGAFAPLGTHHPTCPALLSRPPTPAFGVTHQTIRQTLVWQSSRLTKLTVRQSTVTLPTGPTGMSNKTCFVTPVSFDSTGGNAAGEPAQSGGKSRSYSPPRCMPQVNLRSNQGLASGDLTEAGTRTLRVSPAPSTETTQQIGLTCRLANE